MTRKTVHAAIAVATLAFLTACGGGDASGDNVAMSQQASGVGGIGGTGSQPAGVGGIGGTGSQPAGVGGIGGTGSQPASVAQACRLQGVDVTVAGARVNADGAADLGSPGWIDVPLAAPVRVDLLALAAKGGLPLDLSSLPDGRYGQIRLLLAANDASMPRADTVLSGGLESALSVPSAAQGGLPVALRIDVAAGQATASWQGLDLCSAVTTNSGAYALDAVAGGATLVAAIH
jgi:hypothetical protein